VLFRSHFVEKIGKSVFQHLWKPYSRLCIKDDGAGWVLSGEATELRTIARQLGIHLVPPKIIPSDRRSINFLHKPIFSAQRLKL
jgi:hypothetical protein